MTTELELRRGYEDDGMSEREIEAALDQAEIAADRERDEAAEASMMEITIDKIGSLDVDDGHDQYVLLTRKDDNTLTPEQAEAWLLPRVYRDSGVPGGYYCKKVYAVQAAYSESQVICTIQHRYDV